MFPAAEGSRRSCRIGQIYEYTDLSLGKGHHRVLQLRSTVHSSRNQSRVLSLTSTSTFLSFGKISLGRLSVRGVRNNPSGHSFFPQIHPLDRQPRQAPPSVCCSIIVFSPISLQSSRDMRTHFCPVRSGIDRSICEGRPAPAQFSKQPRSLSLRTCGMASSIIGLSLALSLRSRRGGKRGGGGGVSAEGERVCVPVL